MFVNLIQIYVPYHNMIDIQKNFKLNICDPT